MAVICPTVLAEEAHAYREQMERIAPFAKRLQIDLTDGIFAPSKTVSLNEIWWPDQVRADIHLMYKHPAKELELLIKLKPHLVIIHAEADVDLKAFAGSLHEHDIKAGLCLLKDTPVDSVREQLPDFDHLLVFSGTLGFFGGAADLGLLDKARQSKAIAPRIEIGWDGGVNDQNAKALATGGVDVLNVGGFIQKAENPGEAYAKLKSIVEGNT